MSGVTHVLAGVGGDVAPAWVSPVAVFAVVVGLLIVVFGVAYAVIGAVGLVRRRREQNAVSRLIGRVDRPTPAPTPHQLRRIVWGGRHV